MRGSITLFLSLFFVLYAHAQSVISGTVSDVAGEPLVGVTVLEKGSTNGTTTDFDGAYTLKCRHNKPVLVFSMIGYLSTEAIPAGDNNSVNIILQENTVSLSGIEVVGTRAINRSATETPLPIDIIPVSQVAANVGQPDLNQLLQYVAPSFNSNRQSGSDGSDHIDPATLRGLGPDQTLVLVNGKRRHQSSLINIYGTRGRGNTGTDLNTIPAAAIERIEILRDGASAQYGSDAIAGVMNIVLKNSVDEFNGVITAGQCKEGDGKMLNLSGNYGFKMGEKGFTNVTLNYLSRGRTNRATDSLYRLQFGDAEANDFTAMFNSSMPLGGSTELYAFGSYNYRFTDAFAWSRSAGSARNILSIYPNGFDPHIQSTINDKAISAGLRGKVRGWNTDFNNTFGMNNFHFYVDGTLNASLQEKSPTRFDAGGFQFSQNTTGLTFSRPFESVAKGLNVAFGTEYRIDNYQIFAGEEGSYQTYDKDGLPLNIFTPDDKIVYQTDANGELVLDEDGNPTRRPGGAQGFPGFQPANEVNEYRTNIGAFVDTELDITDAFMIGAAVRMEHYSDFGNTFNYKLASRFEINDNIALRASVSTGFRAPSLAQLYYNTIFTNVISGQAIDVVIAKNNSPLTHALGIPALKQEKSFNVGFGVTLKPIAGMSLTVDAYSVDITDRVVLTGTFYDDDEQIGADLRALNVGAAQFFTNALDTKTLGLDVILTYARKLGLGRLQATVAANFNKMELGDIKTSGKLVGKESTYFGKREEAFLLASAPPSKVNVTLDYKINKVNFNVRAVHFGEVKLMDWLDRDDIYSPKLTLDASLGYSLTPNVTLTVGAANLTDAYPDVQDIETEGGGNYDAVQMGYAGMFYFGRLSFKF